MAHSRILPVATTLIVAMSLLNTASAKDIKKIGLAIPNLEASFFVQIKGAAEAEAAKHGITIVTADAKGDSASQVGQVQDMLSDGIDALIYIPAGANAAAIPAKAAKAAGIPVINIDRNVDSAPGNSFIATDGVTSAKAVVDYLLKQSGGKGEIAIIHGQKGTTPEVDRTAGAKSAIAEHSEVKIVAEQWSQNWSRPEGLKIAQAMLEAHPKLSVIFAEADGLALGAADAVKSANVDHKVWIGGFDGDLAALEGLKAGTIDVTATQKTNSFGRKAVDDAIAVASGDTVKASQLEAAALTTKENADEFIKSHP